MCNRYSSDEFCNLCAHYVTVRNRRKITDRVKELYLDIYGEEINQEYYAPSSICLNCSKSLYEFAIGETNMLKIKKPAKWGEWFYSDHRDCFFHNVFVNRNNYRTMLPKNSTYFPPELA